MSSGGPVPDVRFFDDDSCFDQTYDLVMASCAIQYAQDWLALVRRLGDASEQYVLLTSVPTVMDVEPFVVLQRTQRRRFDTEYLSWVFRRADLVDGATASGLRLVREFLQGFSPNVHNAPERPRGRAFLFARER